MAVLLPEFIVRPERQRPGYSYQFQRIYCRTDACKNSFFPFTAKQWNACHCLSEHPTSFPGCSFIPSPLAIISVMFLTTSNMYHSFTFNPSQLVSGNHYCTLSCLFPTPLRNSLMRRKRIIYPDSE